MRKIVINGVDTLNKGAELMLMAILQEIGRREPDAVCFLPYCVVENGLERIQSPVRICAKPGAGIITLSRRLHLRGLLRKLGILPAFLDDMSAVRGADLFLDASGLLFSDQMAQPRYRIRNWEKMLRAYHRQGTKIVFLPQAFGPAELPSTKRLIRAIAQNADLVMPRDRVSHDCLLPLIPKDKLAGYPDFTIAVGEQHTPGKGVCIIPNRRMIDRGGQDAESYIQLLRSVAQDAQNAGLEPFLLNHEGPQDAALCAQVSGSFHPALPIVQADGALEIKSVIAKSYLCISSRFHGAASALGSAVPCLATGWSHKYEELFKDYGLDASYLLKDGDPMNPRIGELLSEDGNAAMRERLSRRIPDLKELTEEMWDTVWSIL